MKTLRSPYIDVAKYAFCLVGGAGAAVTLCMGTWRLGKRAVEFLRDSAPPPLAEPTDDEAKKVVVVKDV